MKLKASDTFEENKIFLWIAAVVALVLLVPLVAMRFSDEVDWNLFDFIIMGALMYATGSIFVLAARKWRKRRLAIGIAVAIAFFYVWAELAVGIFTDLGS